jgi:ribonuclease T2
MAGTKILHATDECDGKFNTTDLGCDTTRIYHDMESRLTFLTSSDPAFLAEMKLYWPGANLDYNWFWSHEWTKHGTCHSQIDPVCYGTRYTKDREVIDYFKTALKLRSRYDIYKIFAKNGIFPSKTKAYTRSQLNQALKNELGFPGGIQCVFNGTSPTTANGNTYFLSEVWVYMLNLPNMEFKTASPDLITFGKGAFQSCPADKPIYYWPNDFN